MMSIKTLQIPNYQTTEQIYNGNRTIVYRGICSDTGKPVVIKLLKKDYPTFNEIVQFRNQYAITKNLDVTGIVKPIALETCGNGLALIMEDDGSISLSAELKTREYKGVALEEFFPMAIQLTEILEGLYKNRVIHKDIKPANILIHPQTTQIKLIDFSISSLLPKEQQEIQNPNILEGTLAYISPEQTGRMNRGIDYRSDFYSLGVTFYELLTGKLPFESDDAMELVHCHLARTALPLGERVKGKGEGKDRNSPSVLSDIVMRLMAKNAEERYQSALGLKHDLEKCWQQWQETGKIETFELGERDICDRFLIPEKLYGREQEVQTLLESFNRVAEGQSEMMLVAGFSGIGKTAVVNEVHKPIVEKRGYFIKGKYDQFNRNIPFSAFVQAFRDLIGQLLGESDNELANWKGKILEAVGDNGQVLIEVIPELEQVIGQQPTATELSGTAAQNRFNLLFQKFIAVFTTPEHPLVMFLDDLQWADSASLNLMKVLMGESDAGYLLLLGAYRDNEVFPAHPLMLCLGELEKQKAVISTITLEPLELEQVNQLVAEILDCKVDLAQPLTELVYQKTQGNPFFSTQFLKGLYEDELILFNLDLGYWECDFVKVRDASLTDDVVEFMAGRLQKLPETTQEVLKLAACIGNQFDLETLVIVRESSSAEIATEIWQALQEGMVIPISEAYKFFQGEIGSNQSKTATVNYRFLHDRVQQAAYSLIPNEQKQATHLAIGYLLLENIPEGDHNHRIFDITNHINLGRDLITESEQRLQLANLNLQAGQKAQQGGAYHAAFAHICVGLECLPAANCWQECYELTLQLYREGANAAYTSGEFATMDEWINIALTHIITLLDRVPFYETQIQALVARKQLSEAIQLGLETLEQLGETFNEYPKPEDFPQGIQAITASLAGREIEDLIDMPPITNPCTLAVLRILWRLSSALAISAPQLMPFCTFKAVQHSIREGNSILSAPAYATYGMILCSAIGDVPKGYRFGKLALDILNKFDGKTVYVKTLVRFETGVCHWHDSLHDTLPRLSPGYQLALEVGDLESAAICAAGYGYHSYFCGQELTQLEQELKTYSQGIQAIGQQTVLHWNNIYHQQVLNLLGQSEDPCRLVGTAYDETVCIPMQQQYQDGIGLGIAYIFKGISCYLFHQRDYAIENFELAANYTKRLAPFLFSTAFHFYRALAHLSCYEMASCAIEDELPKMVTEGREKLHNWAKYAPMNYQHKWDLLEAERTRSLGNKTLAIEFYDRAIAGAKENGYLQEEALANELAAKFYLEWGKETIAQAYLTKAYYCYASWGAKAKNDHLEATYPQLLTPILQPRQEETISKHHTLTSLETSSPSFTSTHTSLSESLDLATVLKASQSLSQEIHLESLLCVLMEVIVTNAGANQGTLLWFKDNNLLVAAHWQEDNQCQLPNLPLEQYPHLPLSLINTVKRSHETIIVNQGSLEKRWAGDTYLIEHQPQSYLCTPILHQGKLLALLYLENKLTPEAFTERRLEILTMLTAQAAISLENAQLYQTLEEKVEQRTSELRAAQKQIISQEKLASLGALTAGVAHELRNPLNFVTNYAEGSVEMGKELIEEFSGEQPPNQEDWGYVQETLVELQENATAIYQHGQRAESIIHNMMQHSKSKDSSRQLTDINKLVDKAQRSAYRSQKSQDKSFNITFTTEYDQSVGELEVFSTSLNRALINLINNGCYAAWSRYKEEGESFSPQLWITTKNLGKEIEICIRDNGTGIPNDVVEKIFEPFFTTKPTGEGTGLGLSLTHESIVGQHGGTLKVNTEPGNCTEFIIALPQNT